MSYREVSEVRDGMRIDWDMPIEMDDGLVLRCDVFRPVKKGRYPVLLSHGPYGKWLHFEDGYKTAWDRMALKHPDVMGGSTNKYQSWEVCDPEKWVPDGYVCVRVDSRGCGRSPGYVEHWSPRETKDFHDCIEWAGVQPWSNGKVGLTGISYYAINQWQVASLQPKHLAAICVWEGFADFYRELSHNGGIYNTFAQNWYDMQVKTVQYGLGSKGHRSRMNGDWVSGPETLTAEQMGANRYDIGKTYVRAPARRRLLQGDGAGLVEGDGADALSRQLGRPAAASARQFRGLLPRRLQAEMARGARHRALDALLHRLRRRPAEEVLRLFPQGREERLGQAAARAAQRPPSGRKVRHPPRDRLAARAHAMDQIPSGDRRAKAGREPPGGPATVTFDAMGDGVTFLTEPMAQETEITGPVAVKLNVSSSTTDADMFLVLRVFSPDMKEVVFQGALDPHTRSARAGCAPRTASSTRSLTCPYRPYHSHDEKQPLKPGEVYELDIEIRPTCIVVPKGYRIGAEHPRARLRLSRRLAAASSPT